MATPALGFVEADGDDDAGELEGVDDADAPDPELEPVDDGDADELPPAVPTTPPKTAWGDTLRDASAAAAL